MSNFGPSEERYPLLLLFLEDGQRSNKQYKRISIDKNRYKGITSGASAVITQWPGHLTTCWLTSVLMGLVLLLITVTMFTLSLRPSVHFLTSHCKIRHIDTMEQYSTNVIHLTHTCDPWTEKQLNFLELIAQNYQQLTINLIMVHNQPNLSSTLSHYPFPSEAFLKTQKHQQNLTDVSKSLTATTSPTKTKFKRSASRKRANKNAFHLIINIGTQKLLKLLLEKRKASKTSSPELENTTPSPVKINTIENLLEAFPNIKLIHETYQTSFGNTPLSSTWPNLNEPTKLFAIRVLQMWNFAGITFDIPGEPGNPELSDASLTFEKLISTGQESFKNLPEGLVTVDNEGVHMETKTVCHAFFGEMLVGLRLANKFAMPEDIVSGALIKFCRRGAVDPDYCKKIEKSRNF